jgi:hypothetical protein
MVDFVDGPAALFARWLVGTVEDVEFERTSAVNLIFGLVFQALDAAKFVGWLWLGWGWVEWRDVVIR